VYTVQKHLKIVPWEEGGEDHFSLNRRTSSVGIVLLVTFFQAISFNHMDDLCTSSVPNYKTF
jgi:hypothetical protein